MVIDRRNHVREGRAVEYIKTTARLIFWTADTITVRLLLANASLLWAIGLTLDPETFHRNGYQIMAIFGGERTWAFFFILHFIGVYWRLFEARSRPNWALLINCYGLIIWLMSTLSINISIGRFVPSTSLEWVLCCASAWALYRTGLKQEIVTP